MNPLKEGQLLVFGGGFDPPHLGHLQALKDCVALTRPKAILVPVSADPIGKTARASFEKRLQMARLAFSELQATVLDWEYTKGIRYTTDLLTAIHGHYQSEVTFCVGADQALKFETWRNFPRVLSQSNWLILARRGFSEAELQIRLRSWQQSGYFGSERRTAKILETNAAEISSTEVRSLLERGEFDQAAKFLSGEVIRFIEKEGLYGSRNTDSLRR